MNDTHHKASTKVKDLKGEDLENDGSNLSYGDLSLYNKSHNKLAQRSGVTIEACLAVHNDW